MKVAIVGSRNVHKMDKAFIFNRLPDACTAIISGGAAGVDSMAEQIAREKNIPFVAYKPNYQKHGKKAPLIRNLQIIENADLVLAFWDFQSKGTAHTIVLCLKKQIPVRIYALEKSVE